MALDFVGSNTDRVAITTHSSFENQSAVSMLVWARFDTFTDNQYVFRKGGQKQSKAVTSSELDFRVERATTHASLTTNQSFSINTEYFLGYTYDESDGARLFFGTPSTTVQEASYSSRVVGSGATVNDSTDDFFIGNALAAAFSLNGQISTFMWFNARLTLADLQRQQNNIWFPLRSTDCKIFFNLGFNGTGSQRDWSGNGNHGTVTGATKANHVPLPQSLQRFYFIPAAVAAGRTTKNTDSHPLGIHTAISWRLPTHL